MSKLLFLRNIRGLDEPTLRQIINSKNLPCGTIMFKSNGACATVDFMDSSTAEYALTLLNGMQLQDCTLVAEPYNGLHSQMVKKASAANLPSHIANAFMTMTPNDMDQSQQANQGNTQDYNGYAYNQNSQYQQRQPSQSANKIVISNVPSSVRFEQLEQVLLQFGQVKDIEKLNQRDGPTQVVQITFESAEQAHNALANLTGFELEGCQIKIEPAMERRGRSGVRPRHVPFGTAGSSSGVGNRQTEFPLRILVHSDMVGAIIGRGGSTIRQITQQTRARVDVHRKDNVGSLEKAITIYGNPENCTNACRKILEVMQQEASNTNKGDVILKILAHNNLIGRIIGKEGNTIKRIMSETETKITVSSFNYERIITVKGSIENMSKAEAQISAKLRQSFENDLQSMAPQTVMFPGLHPMAMMSASGITYPGRGGPTNYQPFAPAPYPQMYPSTIPPINPALAADVQETAFLFIPNSAVGAIIGTKGSNIRSMIRFSGASVKVASTDNEKPGTPVDANSAQQASRKVTIVGSAEAQWKAQGMIFDKLRDEGFVPATEEVRLTVEILVPSSQVGRIIGRGGSNVRELQRVTGSIIKLPTQGSTDGSEDTTTVHIIGHFLATQSAQRRIRSMVASGANPAPRPTRNSRPTETPQQ
ncbi:insulin-like growth factor 2 mRNA-binding protein 1 isoform X2 [Daktulosphaira vitifoliae]|uniref:insulin-like growth factor 2 mRNA-binding protein 1 isoform X2 n=1 Tax=Daktulosphaira vitifoliae TaxID=58002 RepID=UPI0021AAE6D1|nr:insulin-like growth factor 2 mRNA-binding protein 1 isoform X2 [Daktulosphaira vitifoliae]